MSPISEATVESAVLAWLEGAGWAAVGRVPEEEEEAISRGG